MNLSNKKVIILGGGISGLSLAWSLKKRYGDQIELTLLERGSRFGGWIQSIRHEGSIFELGPRSCRTTGPGASTLKLVEELGLQNEVIVGSSDANQRYLYSKQVLQPIPKNPFHFALSPLTRRFCLPLIKERWAAVSREDEESIESFFCRRLNKEFTDSLIDPMVTGIYAGDISKLSMKSCFPKIWQWEKTHGSLLKGLLNNKPEKGPSPFVRQIQKSAIFSFRHGMETLILELSRRLEPLLKNKKNIVGLHFSDEIVSIKTEEGDLMTCDYVISTLPSHVIAPLLSKQYPKLSNHLISISFASIVGVNLSYSNDVLKKKGFGYLIPSKEKEEILGVVWDSSVFPEQNGFKNQTRLTVMMGGVHRPDIQRMTEEEILMMALKSLKKHLGITALPNHHIIHIAKNAIPQYVLGYEALLKNITLELPPRLQLHGHSFKGVAINDLVAFSENCCN